MLTCKGRLSQKMAILTTRVSVRTPSLRSLRRDFTSVVIGGLFMLFVTTVYQVSNKQVIRVDVEYGSTKRAVRSLPKCLCSCDGNSTDFTQELDGLPVGGKNSAINFSDLLIDNISQQEANLKNSTGHEMGEDVLPGVRTTVSERRPTVSRSRVQHSVSIKDIHPPEIPDKDRVGSPLVFVAIGMSITSKKVGEITKDNIREKLVFFKALLPSFCETRSADSFYVYKFYIAYDHNDTFFMVGQNRLLFTYTFQSMIKEKCLHFSQQYIWLKLIRCNHSTKPAWAQNDAMMDAYLDDYDYYYRLNDDVIMTTSNWTGKLISRLRNYHPKNVGMVSPTHTGGHPEHYEFDFVHRTHIDIFGYYYPRVFLDLYADEWIGKVYLAFGRCMKLPDVSIIHTQAMGKRYNEKLEGGGAVRSMFRTNELIRGKFTLRRFMSYFTNYGTSYQHNNPHRVIAMSLAGNNPDELWGALRNVFLAKVYFPAFKVRFYISNPKLNNSYTVNPRFIKRLISVGADVKQLATSFAMSVPVPLWKYISLDDQQIFYLILRDPASRLTSQDKLQVSDFIARVTHKLISCFRDYLPAENVPFDDNRIAVKSKLLRIKFSKRVKTMLEEIPYYISHHTRGKDSPEEKTRSFLHHFLWPRVRAYSYIYDSTVSQDRASSYVHPIPHRLQLKTEVRRWSYIGRKYDAFDTLPVFLQNEYELKKEQMEMSDDKA